MSGSETPAGTPTLVDREPAPDLRLAPLVAGVWLGGALVLLSQPVRPLLWGGAGGVALTAGMLVARGRTRRQGGRAPRLRRQVLLLVLCGAALGGVVSALHLARLHPPPIEDAAAAGAVLRVEAVITGDPRAHAPADHGGRVIPSSWSVTARAVGVAIRERTYAARIPILLRGDQVRGLRYGSRVHLTGRAGQTWAPELHAFTLQVLGEVQVRSPPGRVARVTTGIRQAFREACRGLPPDAGALLLGLAVGDESTVSPQLDEAMIRSGLAHLTAVSGSNTSLVVGIAMAAVAGLGLGWRARVGICLGVLWGYVLLVRPEPSVLRAAGMGVVALIALSAGGRRRGPPALFASGLGLLLVLPQFSLSMGFALSFAATAGLLVVGPPLASRLARWPVTAWVPEPIRAALAVAVAAHLATLPLVVVMGNGASLVALPANVVVTPLVPVATVLGLAAALLAPVAPAVAEVAASVASPATWLIAEVAHRASAVPGGVIDVAPGPATVAGAVLVAGGLAAAIVARWRPRRHGRPLVAVAAAVALVMAVVHLRPSHWPPPGWVVLACDVGQGDGLLLRAPGSADALLVDAGPDAERIESCLRGAGVRRLAVLITHFHADHIDGLSAVLARWPVSAILMSPVPEPAAGAQRVAQLAGDAGVTTRSVRAGARLDAFGVRVSVLWPTRRVAQSAANNSSIVAVATVPTPNGGLTALLTGDIEQEAQAVLAAGDPPAASIVKVPHHGSAYQDPGFAAWSGARVALISVGQGNDYGHPSEATIAQYRQVGAVVGRTDRDGDLAVVPTALGAALVSRR